MVVPNVMDGLDTLTVRGEHGLRISNLWIWKEMATFSIFPLCAAALSSTK